MNDLRTNSILAAIALTLAASSCAGWATNVARPAAPAVAIAAAAGTLLVAGAAITLLLASFKRERRLVRSFLEQIADLQPPMAQAPDVPALGARHPLQGLLGRVQEALGNICQRLQDLEHSRTALEVRTRRYKLQQDRITSILDGLNEPVLAVDNYDELVLANPSAQRLFDLQPAEADVGRRALSRLLHCEQLVELLKDARRRRIPTTRTEEFEVRDDQGSARWYRATASTLSAEQADAAGLDAGAPPGAVVVMRDVTEQRGAQTRHAEFVSAVSHEMKAPLASIKAYVELLADGDAEDEATQEEFLHVINTQAERMQRLIDNLLNLARIEAGVAKVNKAQHSLNDLLEEALRVMQPAAEKKHISLKSDLSLLYLGVFADRDMLLQAAINLLSNAIKYTPDGGRVTLRSRLEDGRALFEVEDTGVGLSEEDCARVFEKFYRVKKNSEMAPGTGLGLALVKQILEDVHGGQLSLTSRLGEGSVFTAAMAGTGPTS